MQGDRFMIGGDWNTCRAFDDHLATSDPPSCHGFFDRLGRAGWCETLREHHPDEVRTYLKPGTYGYELDHLFTDTALHGQLTACQVLDHDRIAALSDHAPIVADFDLDHEQGR